LLGNLELELAMLPDVNASPETKRPASGGRRKRSDAADREAPDAPKSRPRGKRAPASRSSRTRSTEKKRAPAKKKRDAKG
jgi:hypothetical protein